MTAPTRSFTTLAPGVRVEQTRTVTERDVVDFAALSGDDNASPVINLQTNFGGGKTHSMLCLWHLAGGLPASSFPQEWQELLQDAGYDLGELLGGGR